MNVLGKHYYVCFIIDLYNREIVGYSVGNRKTPELVLSALQKIEFPLSTVSIFHTDRGLEFKNQKIDKILIENEISRSLSNPGTPFDNAVSESTFKTFKVTSPNSYIYQSEFELYNDVSNFVDWFNTMRSHSYLDYISPIEFKLKYLVT